MDKISKPFKNSDEDRYRKKIVIFGTGFIATNLIKHFQNENSNVECVVIYNKHKLEDRLNVRQYEIDNNIAELISSEKPNYVIVLHGNSFVSNNMHIENSVNDNVLKIASFLEKIYEKKLYVDIEKILVVGSASEYGKFYDLPIEENFALHPTSVYGLSKIFLFNLAKYFIERGLPIVYIRQFNTIGIGQREDFVLPSFAKNIALIEKNIADPILNVGDLSQERDFIDIHDTCRAYDLLLKKGAIGEVYNIASGEYVNIGYLLQVLISKSRLDKEVLKINENKNLFSNEASLSKRLHADISKLKSLGFEKKFTLEQTIEDTLEYWRKNV